MAFTPDVIVTTDYSPATIVLVAEAKGQTADLDEVALQLKHYMLQMSCPVGIIFTPRVLRIYKDRFVNRSEESIELIGEFPSAELFGGMKPAVGPESALESALIHWLDELTHTGQAQVGDPQLKSAIDQYVLPAVSGGRVSVAHPGKLDR